VSRSRGGGVSAVRTPSVTCGTFGNCAGCWEVLQPPGPFEFLNPCRQKFLMTPLPRPAGSVTSQNMIKY